MIDIGERNAFSWLIDIDATYLGRVFSGLKDPSEKVLDKFRDLIRQVNL